MEKSDFDQERLDAEWTALNALREMLLMAKGDKANVTYDESLALAAELSPKLFSPQNSLIARGQEPATIREYRDMAAAESVQKGKQVCPEEILARHIEEAKKLLEFSPGKRNISRRIQRLESYKGYLGSKEYSEH